MKKLKYPFQSIKSASHLLFLNFLAHWVTCLFLSASRSHLSICRAKASERAFYVSCPRRFVTPAMRSALCPLGSSFRYGPCSMRFALCPMPYALCPMPYALCPTRYAIDPANPSSLTVIKLTSFPGSYYS